MKWYYRIMTFGILGLALAFPFFIENKDGKPMLSLPTGDDITASAKKALPPATVYKWRDANGQWHYGDNPPADARELTPMTINTNTNIVQSVKLPKEEAPTVLSPVPGASGGYEPPKSEEDLLTLDRAMNLMKDAQAVRDSMEARGEHLRQIVGESN
ncbi:MAG: DUF4124 domain-containing protein [Oleiphilaceae bacterium]|nr:DUF4124 domain-containing protein [Oleiphilaceae bacterium]